MSFDTVTATQLRATGGLKWSKYPEALGAFVAEMDFGVPPAVTRALHGSVGSGLLGYLPSWLEQELQCATSEWMSTRYDWTIPPEDVLPTADVILACELALRVLTPPEAKVVVMTPAYGPFFGLSAVLGREVIEVPMIRDRQSWAVDLDGIAAAFRAGGGILVLCNPHNPIGKVYTRAELDAIAEIVDYHGGRVFADEIHAPVMYGGGRHIPYASISEIAAAHALTATSASKGFNLAGLKCAQIVVGNDADRRTLGRLHDYITHGCATLGAIATVAAYREGRLWLDEVVSYLEGNRDLVARMLPEIAPEIGFSHPAATYFSWLDVRPLRLDDPRSYFLHHAQVALSDGVGFGSVGQGHVRLNLAMPRPLLEQAVTAIAESAARSSAV
ncbi:aminotransferase class I/II-fold pyridoxal phosphate-dependent enzyme [Rhodococcus spelaei]|uniref:cysteine-S-conjugate beta-lyase n=1 Tax=Rhodococcus spelaei TaxID=2546320 RepID=A0A541BAM1_9NOCA|nr:aminotransferase class I/II-fold pyridoxal phosphate-dependent enzyme [Rhodococcus spelaei]TQF69349.1 aminotransferase class I/II-fold pyridoxal phosphate-dependent enzyme [Rhodococcus spelaei]